MILRAKTIISVHNVNNVSQVDTEFLTVIYMNVIFRKFIKVVNAASVPILRLMEFSSPVIFTGFNFVFDLHLL